MITFVMVWLLEVFFGVKCNNNPKRVQKYEILAFEKKKFPKGCPKKKILKIFQKIFLTT